ncbi:hypothetical protein CGS46_14640 [Faecalibacterium langellae]|jgi:hypothetical protein|uniref:Uncharacterized protein n=1 Tax=Faecalibacterium langellae TaxID=3435293 RepID=A0A2A6Z8P4_9FIRM|nr:hypothetical protein [Faecalibacterium prausnitzii]PDX57729.1 hypothetical protein CGS46_14640 [Faecalibacterium prausnitzii]
MGFFKKLFTGIGFAAGFLFFGCLSVIVYASRGRHKPRYRRSSFWNTLERYLIFSWICEGVRSSRKRAETSYCQRTGGDFWQMQTQARPASVKNSAPEVKTPRPEAKNTGTGATRSVKPKRAERPSAAQKASVAQSGAKSVSVPTVLGQNVSEADAEKHSEWSKPKPEPKQEHAAQQSETKEVHQKSAQQLEAERQQKLETLRTAMQKQICAIHADVELSANGQNDSGAVEQKLHVLLYKSTLTENDLNRALDELRTERRRQKAEYQGAPFADVFLVNLILSDEDSERACTVDVGDTGMSYVIPWSSIPKDLQESLHRYVSEAEGKLCGYCKEELCNSESGRMVVELYLGKQEHHVSRILY